MSGGLRKASEQVCCMSSALGRTISSLLRKRLTAPNDVTGGFGYESGLTAGWARLLNIGLPEATASISERESLAIHALWACLKCISEDVARHTFYVAKQVGHDEYEPVWEHPLNRVLNWRANREMSAYGFWECMIWNAALRGNAYCEIVGTPYQAVSELWPLPTRQMEPHRDQQTGELVYDFHGQRGSTLGIPMAAILHLRNLSEDGLVGMDWRSIHAGTTLAAPSRMNTFLTSFLKNMMRPSAVLTFPANLDPEQAVALGKRYKEQVAGRRAGDPLVAFGGMQYQSLQMDLDTAQFSQLRDKTPSEVCGLLRVPPHKIGDLSRSTNNNIEAQDTAYNTETLGPWRARIEGEASRLVEDEGLVVIADEWELTRGAFTQRSQAMERYIRVGLMSKNEARVREGFTRVNHPAMDTYQFDVNSVPHDQQAAAVAARIGKATPTNPATPATNPAGRSARGDSAATVLAFEPLIRQHLARSLRIERDRLSRCREKSAGAGAGNEYSRRAIEVLDELESDVRVALTPTLQTVATLLAGNTGQDQDASAAAAQLAGTHRRESQCKLVHQLHAAWSDEQVEAEAQRRASVLVAEWASRWESPKQGA